MPTPPLNAAKLAFTKPILSTESSNWLGPMTILPFLASRTFTIFPSTEPLNLSGGMAYQSPFMVSTRL